MTGSGAQARAARLRVVGGREPAVSLLEEHLEWMRRCGRSERTIRCRRTALDQLAEWLGGDPAAATFEQLDAWQQSFRSLKNMSWNTALIRPYYKWLHARGVRQDNPAAILPTPRLPRGLPRPISEERLAAAVADAPARLRPWLLLAGWCGLRAAEIAGLAREAFCVDGGGQVWVRIVGKGLHVRDVPVPDWVWEIIAPALPTSGPCWRRERGTGPVTPKHVSIVANRYLRSRGFPDTLHALRHRAATEVLRASGWNLRVAQDFLGHGDLKTLQIYTRVRPELMAAAVGALGRPSGLAPGPAGG